MIMRRKIPTPATIIKYIESEEVLSEVFTSRSWEFPEIIEILEMQLRTNASGDYPAGQV